jgi:hypothetical protein
VLQKDRREPCISFQVALKLVRRYSLPALILELGRHELETGDPNVDRTMRLTDQERQTREVWLILVYLTLHRIGHKTSSGTAVPPRPTDTLGLGALVDSTVCMSVSVSVLFRGLRGLPV